MSDKKDSLDIRLFNLSNYSRPQIIENRHKNWVLNGKHNSFYGTIIDRVTGSPTNSAINNSYIDLIYGKGLGANNSSTNFKDWVQLKQILKKQDLKRIVADFQYFNEFSFQVIKTKGKKLSSIKHIPKNKVAPALPNEDNEIESYWFSNDWQRTNQDANVPKEISAFGTSKDAIEIFVGRPYKAGKDFFPDPDWLAGIPYAEMEEEIANLNIHSIQNGLSAGYIINVPDGKSLTPEEKETFERKIKQKLTGTNNATNFVLSFNGRDAEITITPFPVNDNIHKQWQFLTGEARQQLLTAHRVTSPMIFGIKDNTGLGNNANELKESFKLMYQTVIPPKQDLILDSLTEVLEFYGINLDLFFMPLVNLEELDTTTKMSVEMSDEDFAFLEQLSVSEPEGYDLTDGTEYIAQLKASQTSAQDSKIWKVRYKYVKGTRKVSKGGHRAFCARMLALAAAGRLFREEDIDLMSSQGVNGQFAHSGGSYDIFKFAGGVNCYHRWERRVFKKRLNADGTPKKGGALQQTIPVNINEARRQGAKLPKNDPDVAIAEIDKANNGRF